MADGNQGNSTSPEYLIAADSKEKVQNHTLQQKVDEELRKTADAQEKGRKQAEAYIKRYGEITELLRQPPPPLQPERRLLDDGTPDESTGAKKRYQEDQELYKKQMETHAKELKTWQENRPGNAKELQQVGKNLIDIGVPALDPLLDAYLSLDPMTDDNDPLYQYGNILLAICNNNPRSGAFERVFLRRADLRGDPLFLFDPLLQNAESGLQNQAILGFISGEAWEHIYPPLTGAIAKEFHTLAQGKTPAERKAMEMRLREYLYHFRGENQQERGWPLVSSMIFRRPARRPPMPLLTDVAGSIVQAGGTEVRNALIEQESDKQRAARMKGDAADQRKFDRQMTDWRDEQQPFTAEGGLLILMQRSDWGQLQSRLDQIIDQVGGNHSRDNLRHIAVTQTRRLLTEESNRAEFAKTGMQTVLRRLSLPDIDPAEETALLSLLHTVNPGALNDVMGQRTQIRLEQTFDLIENAGFDRSNARPNVALWQRIGPVVLQAVRTGGALGRRAALYAEELKLTEIFGGVVIIPKEDWEAVQKSFESMRTSAELDDRLTAIEMLGIRWGQEPMKMLLDMLQRQTADTPLEERIACIEACARKTRPIAESEIIARTITGLLEPPPLSALQLSVTGAARPLRPPVLLSPTDRHRLLVVLASIAGGTVGVNVNPAMRRQIIEQLLSARAEDVPRELRREVVTNVELQAQNSRLFDRIRYYGYAPLELLVELMERPGAANAYMASQCVRLMARDLFRSEEIDPRHFDALRALITRYRNLPASGSPENTTDAARLRIALQEVLVQVHSREVVTIPGDTGANAKILQDLRKQITDLGIEAPPRPAPVFEE